MFEIDLKSRKTISEQITDNMRELILSGVLRKGERIPSVREMAKTLTVNPNTVQKAYRTLEELGYIYTSRGRGTFVTDAEEITADKTAVRQARIHLEDALSELYLLGISKKDAEDMISKALDERKEWK